MGGFFVDMFSKIKHDLIKMIYSQNVVKNMIEDLEKEIKTQPMGSPKREKAEKELEALKKQARKHGMKVDN